MTADDVWRWLAMGLGGLTGMVLAQHNDPASGPCPRQWLDSLAENVAKLARVVEERRASNADTEHTGQDV